MVLTSSVALLSACLAALPGPKGPGDRLTHDEFNAVVSEVEALKARNSAVATTTVVSTSSTQPMSGQTVTLTATVTAADGTTPPAGLMVFFDGHTGIGVGYPVNGVATLVTPALTAGIHRFWTIYPGGLSTYGMSAAVPVLVTVQQSAGWPSTTTLTSSVNPSQVGGAVVLTATVTGTVIPTGTIIFYDGASVLGTQGLDAAGRATLSTSSLGAGSHNLTAAYGGSLTYAPSTSSALAQVVITATTMVLAVSPSPSYVGQAVTFTATMTPGVSGGAVVLADNGSAIFSVDMSGGATSSVGTWTTTSQAQGSHSYTASFAGSPGFQPATSQTVSHSVEVFGQCTDYSYTAWGACVNGTETRSVTGYLPEGCGVEPTAATVLTRACGATVTPNLISVSSPAGAGWTSSGATVTPGQTDPAGGTTAVRVTAVAGSGTLVRYSVPVSGSTQYTLSFYASPASAGTDGRMSVADGVAPITLDNTYADAGELAATGWSRIVRTFTTGAGATVLDVYPARNAVAATDVYLAGVRLEAGAAATGTFATVDGTTFGATAPGAPTIGVASAGNAQATVAFTAPASNGGATITSYTATSSPGSVGGSGSSSPITVSGLTNGTAYTFTVRATNSVGSGPASAASNSVTPTAGGAATVPGAPTIGVAVAGDVRATVPFTAPASNGGSAITKYTATSSPGGLTGTSEGGTITVLGLDAGTPYTFTVTATNAVGTGAASGASNSINPSIATGNWVMGPMLSHPGGSYAPGTLPVTMASATVGAAIFYCTGSSSCTPTTPYTGTVTVPVPGFIKAIATYAGMNQQADSSASSASEAYYDPNTQHLAAPCTAYTYSAWGSCSGTTSMKSRTVATRTPSGCTDEFFVPPVLEEYCGLVITDTLAAPTFSPLGGIYSAGQTVSIAQSQGGTIQYCVGESTSEVDVGCDPWRQGTTYTGPFTVSYSTTVRATATLAGWFPAPTVSSNYLVSPATDVAAPRLRSFTRGVVSGNSVPLNILAVDVYGGTGVIGHGVTTSSTPPAAASLTNGPAFTYTGTGTVTLYPWTRDGANNISAVATPITVTLGTSTTPVVNALQSGAVEGLTAWFAIDASSSGGITGYALTADTATAPTAGQITSTSPYQSYTGTAGAHAIRAYVKNAAGAVSPAFGPVNVTLAAPSTGTRPAYNLDSAGFYVAANGKVYDGNDQEFRIRGINKLHPDSPWPGLVSTGANTVRWNFTTNAVTPHYQLSEAMAQAWAWGLVFMPAPQDMVLFDYPLRSTGEQGNAAFRLLVDKWVAMATSYNSLPHSEHSLVNIANEWAPAYDTGSKLWRDEYCTAIKRLRGVHTSGNAATPYKQLIVVDAGGNGQDASWLLATDPDFAGPGTRTFAQSVLACDPRKSVIFSVHVYNLWTSLLSGPLAHEPDGVVADWNLGNYWKSWARTRVGTSSQQTRVETIFPLLGAAPSTLGTTIIVGEYGVGRGRGWPDTGLNSGSCWLKPSLIVAQAEMAGIGHVAWAWDDPVPNWNNEGMSMTTSPVGDNRYMTLHPQDLTDFGRAVVTHPVHGLKVTAKKATIFGAGGGSASLLPFTLPFTLIASP